MSDMYKRALKKKLRFRFHGVISVEDLFDLDLEQLDSIYKDLMGQKKDDDAGLLKKRTRADVELDLALEIVEDIFNDKEEAADKRKAAAEKKAKKDRILEIMADKQDEELKGLTLEELQEMADGL